MEKINDLIFEIKKLSEDFVTEATNNVKGNKVAGRRARKISQAMTKLFKDYRALTIEAEKKPEK